MFFSKNSITASFLISMIMPATAAVVISPSSILTHAGAGSSNDPTAPDQWLRSNVRDGSSVGITTTLPLLGNGSFEMTGTNSTSKADIEYYSSTGFGILGDLDNVSYQWYRSSGGSNIPGSLHPFVRLIYDADGDLGTNDQGYLIFERAYNGGGPTVPTDTWVQDQIDASTNIWQVSFGNGINTIFNRSLDDWRNGYTQTASEISQGHDLLTANSLIIGVSSGIGSGWNGTFSGGVDDISLTSNGVELLNANFEVVPEPSSSFLLTLATAMLLFKRRL